MVHSTDGSRANGSSSATKFQIAVAEPNFQVAFSSDRLGAISVQPQVHFCNYCTKLTHKTRSSQNDFVKFKSGGRL